jgi:hypothetical protein
LEIDDGLSTNADEFQIEIQENNAPTAVINSPEYNEILLITSEIYFDGSSCTDPDKHKLYFNWTSNLDGLLGTEESFYLNLSSGTHIITLEINDGYGCSSETSTVITVNTPTIAEAGLDFTIELGNIALFDGSNSTDPDDDELIFKWDFGDDTGDIGEIVNHKYNSEGIYNVTLTVDDGKGGISTDYLVVTVIYVFNGPGIMGHVFNNTTLQPIAGIEIEAYSWDNDQGYYSDYTETNATGYYEFQTPNGYIWIEVYSKYYLSYYTNVSVFDDQAVENDIYLDPVPPITAKVHGYVYDDETKEPIYNADVNLYDIDYDYYEWNYTDKNGYYKIKAPVGEFIINCYVWDDEIDYVDYYATINLKDGQTLRHDIYLKRRIPTDINVTFEFSSSNWDRVTVTSITTEYSDTYYMRMALDQNEDGTISESEVTAYELIIEAQINNMNEDFDTNGTFEVDNISYKYIQNTVNVEIVGAVGPTDSTDPITMISTLELKSNQTIPVSNTHDILLLADYDNSWSTNVYYIKFPTLFELSNYTIGENMTNVTISGVGENLVKIDPTFPPDWWIDNCKIMLEAKRTV